MAHISPSSEIIDAYQQFNASESEISRIENLLLKARADRKEKLERLQRLIKGGHMLEDQLLESIYLHHNGNKDIQPMYAKLAEFYKQGEGKPFAILQFWGTRGLWNSGIVAAVTPPNTHWVLYAGIAQGKLGFDKDHKPVFPMQRYSFTEGIHYFDVKKLGELREGPMRATEKTPDDSKLYHPSGLYDWSKMIATLEHTPRKNLDVFTGLQKENGHELFTFIVSSKESTEHLLASGTFYVIGYGNLIYIDRTTLENIRWSMKESLEKCQAAEVART